MVAYLCSQFHDVWAFHKWREMTKGRYLWLRNNASTAVSQAIDTSLFITIAFVGLYPTGILLTMLWGQYLFKLGIALCDTPFCYLLVSWLRKPAKPIRGVEWR
jgi:hypothetical protein